MFCLADNVVLTEDQVVIISFCFSITSSKLSSSIVNLPLLSDTLNSGYLLINSLIKLLDSNNFSFQALVPSTNPLKEDSTSLNLSLE